MRVSDGRPDWFVRHPFRRGQKVRRIGVNGDDPVCVSMIGESPSGNVPWFTKEGSWMFLDARLYELVPDQPQEKASA